jgi:hypothetical protein
MHSLQELDEEASRGILYGRPHVSISETAKGIARIHLKLCVLLEEYIFLLIYTDVYALEAGGGEMSDVMTSSYC